jgi:hypothetical protein
MTRIGVSVVTTALLLLAASAGTAFGVYGDVRLEQTERRPYIVEIGQPYEIGIQRLQEEINHISALSTYVRDYGYPDYSEIQEIRPEWPWEPYEVRLYYMRRNLEVDFGPVILSEAAPNFGALKFLGDITPEKRHEIEVVLQAREAPPAPPVAMAPAVEPAPPPPPPSEGGLTEALVARIEAAAERAAQAADRAAQDSEAAARAAERTVNIVAKIEQQRAAAR